MAINAIVRATGIAKNTVLKLLSDLGNACAIYQYNTFRDPKCKRLELDEIWSFCFAKQKNVPFEKQGVFGGRPQVVTREMQWSSNNKSAQKYREPR